MKKMLKTKRGLSMSFELLVIMVAVIVAAFLFMGFYNKYLGKGGDITSKQLDSFGDCDLDGLKNFVDKCPCTNYGGKESKVFKGCPEGKDENFVLADKQTCYYYMTNDENNPIASCKGKSEELCLKNTEGEFMSRCEFISTKAVEISNLNRKGEATEGDIEVTSLQVGSESKVATYNKTIEYKTELGPKYTYVQIPVTFTLTNVGTQTTEFSFKARFEICTTDKNQCKPLNKYVNTQVNGIEEYSFDSLQAGESVTRSVELNVGLNGDYCDGSGETSCYVKLTADSAGELWEKSGAGEDNNIAEFKTLIAGQALIEHEFDWFKTIELFGDDNGGPDPEKSTIYQKSKYYVGDDTVEGSPDAQGACDGNLPIALPNNNGCWIFLSEDDVATSDNCGSVTASEGAIISHLYPQVISSNNDFSGEESAKNLLSWYWSAQSDGSLLCKSNYWLICHSNGQDANKMTYVNGKKYTCTANGEWS